jgi:hypothetical protein
MTIQCLYDLAINAYVKVPMFYPPDSGVIQTIINKSKIAGKALPEEAKSSSPRHSPIIQNPELLEMLLDLLKRTVDDGLKLAFFQGLESALNEENCAKLVEVPFIIWVSTLLKTSYLEEWSNMDEVSALIFDIINKITVFDLNRTTKQFKILKSVKKIPNSDFL